MLQVVAYAYVYSHIGARTGARTAIHSSEKLLGAQGRVSNRRGQCRLANAYGKRYSSRRLRWYGTISAILHEIISASIFIVSAVKRGDETVAIIRRDLNSIDAEQRAGALLRFLALWRHRFHCWLQMEDGPSDRRENFKVRLFPFIHHL